MEPLLTYQPDAIAAYFAAKYPEGIAKVAAEVEALQPTKPELPIYTMDLETDPFAYQQMIDPFAVGFYDGKEFWYTWGPECVAEAIARIRTLPPGIIYLHNLGGFDFFWLMKYFRGKSTFRDARIVKARLPITERGMKSKVTQFEMFRGTHHEIRDSYAIMPFALKEYKEDGKRVKKEIDYAKMKKKVRNKHKQEILEYLEVDVVSLYKLVTTFVKAFGRKLTIGGTALEQLQKLQPFIRFDNAKEDFAIRKFFYYGGRVQCLEAGVIKAPLKVYDVNSMYPYVMRNYEHPICRLTSQSTKIQKDTCFVSVVGKNYGAFPQRAEGGGLRWDIEEGHFTVTIHEYLVALELGLFKPTRIHTCLNFQYRKTFAEFVDHFYELRKQAKKDKDSIMSLFYKYILNSAYGKFAQDPSKYFNYQITDLSANLHPKKPCFACDAEECFIHWRAHKIIENFDIILWRKRSKSQYFYNVATGASITGAARSVLLTARAKARHPIYMDTDSIICEELKGVALDDNELGAWKLEATADTAAIAGPKMYALWKRGRVVKDISKGVDLTAKEIRELALDPSKIIAYEKESPTLSTDGTFRFLKRNVRRTAK